MMEEVDKNEDGFISYEEFNQSMLKLVSNHKITLKWKITIILNN
jgi:hypothetical protein